MEPVNNNQFEVVPNPKSKRRIVTPCVSAYLNPALDFLVNDDPMCNNAMELVPKKRKRTKSCDIVTFDNSALDLGISKTAVREFLSRELENVCKNVKSYDGVNNIVQSNRDVSKLNLDVTEPIYTNITPMPSFSQINATTNESIIEKASNLQSGIDLSQVRNEELEITSATCAVEQKSLQPSVANESDANMDVTINNTTNIQTNITNQLVINNANNLSLSFIDRLALDSPNLSNQSLYFDDDLNESNIMEIKTITIITKKKRIPENNNTNPFLCTNLEDMNTIESVENPFLDNNETKSDIEYSEEALSRPIEVQVVQNTNILPRKLFSGDTNSTTSTINESVLNLESHEYENIDNYRSESPIYENIGEISESCFNKQSKLLGHDVSQFSALDIMNLNKYNQSNASNESNENKRDLKNQLKKASNKFSKKVFKTLRKTFKGEKYEKPDPNTTLNPYEIPRTTSKPKVVKKETGIENPALNLDNSDDLDIEEIDDEEHQYETIKTLRNTRLNMNVTPLRERDIDNLDHSHNRTNTPGKKVRFDSTLNKEKIITGNSFNEVQSPGFDAKLQKYHDELENCINERKYLEQNM